MGQHDVFISYTLTCCGIRDTIADMENLLEYLCQPTNFCWAIFVLATFTFIVMIIIVSASTVLINRIIEEYFRFKYSYIKALQEEKLKEE